MSRHVFYASDAPDAKSVRSARAVASKLGATVLKTGLDTMLVEAPAAVVRQVAAALPGWRHSAETSVRMPTRPRAAPRGAKRAAA
jgi:hypothetical protein